MKHPSIIKFQTCVIILIFLYMGMPQELLSQNIAVKSNMLYDLTTTLNVGGEFRCGKNETIHLSLNYNPWEFGDNKKMKHFLIQPEYRWWFEEAFTGSFVGVQTHFAQYNFGGMTPFTTVKENRYQGHLFGLGATYGYQWMLTPFWNLEASFSVGYARLNYKKYGPEKGSLLREESGTNYFGPTQIGISFVFFIQ